MNPAVAVAAGVVFLSEPRAAGIVAAFTLILAGSFLATGASAGRSSGTRRVAWSARQTSRADGRVKLPSPGALPEERPGSTGQGGG
ncbi:hypothetical protein GCM10009837_50070 [Streptomyces durmitorensis]